MQEIKYREVSVWAEDGRPLALSYIILTDKSRVPERYGVKVVEGNSGEFAQITDLTTKTKRAYDLVDKLAKNAVTPTALADIVADWL